METFINQILKNLESNGFPEKAVSLPTEKMYEVADNKGHSLNAVLNKMKEAHQVDYEIQTEKIIFRQEQADMANPFAGMDQSQMMQKAQEYMSQMDPTELQKMQEMFINMSDEEKEDLMQKGKDLGII